jgi:hypothetical protein
MDRTPMRRDTSLTAPMAHAPGRNGQDSAPGEQGGVILARAGTCSVEPSRVRKRSPLPSRAIGALGFSDCLILEIARRAGHLPLGTFDRDLGKLEGGKKL